MCSGYFGDYPNSVTMRSRKTTISTWALLLLPFSIFSQFGLENNAADEAKIYFDKAVVHHDASEFSQAVECYQKSLNFISGQIDAWYNLALVQIHMGEFHQAERSLDTLFQFAPLDAQAHALHGLVLYRQGECDRSVAAYNFALSQNPSKHLLLARGLSHYCSGQLHLASLDFDEVLSIDPGNTRACQAKAALLLEKKNYNMAIRFCNRILDREPNHATALTTRAVCRFRQGAKFRAMADFDLALSEAQLAETYLARAACRVEEKNFDGALMDVKMAIRIQPHEPEVYAVLATIEQSKGELEAAYESIGVALEMSAHRTDYQMIKAELSMQLKLYDEAISATYVAIDLGHDPDEAKSLLRDIYQRMDKVRFQKGFK